jgi:hypothetical protein
VSGKLDPRTTTLYTRAMRGLRKAAIGAPPGQVEGTAGGYSYQLQELWFSLIRKPWASLALLPTHERGSSIEVARRLAAIGGRFRGAPLTLLEGADLDLESAARLTQTVQTAGSSWTSASPQQQRIGVQSEPRTLVALGPLLENPMGVPVALAADAVLLLIERGLTRIPDAQKTLRMIGREHVIGAVLVG